MRAEAERVGSQVAAKREHEAQLHAQADQYEAARNSAVSRFQDLEGQILVLEKALDAKERPQGPQRRFPWLPAHAGARAAVAARERLPPPPPAPRTKWTRRVPHPVLTGHAASLTHPSQGERRCPAPPSGVRARARARPRADAVARCSMLFDTLLRD